MQAMWVQSLVEEDPLEEGMMIHSSILAWRIPWTEEPGGPQSKASQSEMTEHVCVCARARTHTHTHTHTHTPHLRAFALLSPVSAFCRVFHMPCPPLPGFWIYIFQRGLCQGHYLKWAHLFPSWSLLKHHLHLFIYPFSLEITRLWCASPTGMSAPWRLGDVCLLSCGIPSAGYRASLPNPLFVWQPVNSWGQWPVLISERSLPNMVPDTE